MGHNLLQDSSGTGTRRDFGYFKTVMQSMSRSLNSAGYCVIPNIFQHVPAHDLLDRVMMRMCHSYKVNHDDWCSIYNRGETSRDRGMSGRRYMSTGESTNRTLQTEDEESYKEKLQIELWLSYVVGSVLREQGPFATRDEPAPGERMSASDMEDQKTIYFNENVPALNGVQMPANGVRFLVTSENTPRQHAHTDFEWGDHHRIGWYPARGFFIMVSGAMPFKLVLWPGSHLFVRHRDHSLASRICKTLPHEMAVVPPYSVFIGRGDLVHAGAGYADDEDLLKEKFGENRPYPEKIRIHVYVAESQKSFPAAVFTVPECTVKLS